MALTKQELAELNQLEKEQGLPPTIQSGWMGAMQKGDKSVEQKIKSRGDESFAEAGQRFVDTEGGFAKTMAGLNIVAMPFERFEAGIANVALDMQDVKGKNPLDSFKEGITGKRLGEIGDVYRKAGTPEWAAATIGLATTFIPVFEMIGAANKALFKATGLSKFTDKGLKLAGKQLIAGSDDAVKFVGKNLDNVYAPINKVNVNTFDVINLVDDLPPSLVKHIEKEIGKGLEQVSTIEDVRKVKGLIGQFRPTVFGKAERGAIETIEGININKAYAKTKNIIQESLENVGLGKPGKSILAADEAFSETKRAADFIRKASMEGTLKLPTKAGKVASAMTKGGDLSTRTALNTLLKGGKSASESITKAVKHLNDYNRAVAISTVGGKILNYTILGGIAGSIGARTASGIGGDDFSGGQ